MSASVIGPIQVIRPIQEGDAIEIAKLIETCHLNTQFPIGPRWSLEDVQEEMRHLGWVSLGGGGELEAFVLARDMGDAWEISFLATAPNARGQGRMTALLGQLMTVLPTDKAIWLEVHEGNLAARGFYEKHAFREVGRRPRYYADGGAAVLYNYR